MEDDPPVMTLRRRLLLLVASLIVPAVVASASVAWLAYSWERGRAETALITTARAVALQVDQELIGTTRVLQTLANSYFLTVGDLEAFRRQALAAALGDGEWVVLLDGSARQVVNTLRPLGTPLPSHPIPDNVRRIFETRAPLVSNLFFGPVSGHHTFSVEVPVIRDDRVLYDLAAGVPPGVFTQIMNAQKLPAGWVLSVFDRSGVIVARNRQPETFVGKPVAAGLLARLAQVDEGAVEVPTLENIPVLAAFSRAPVSGWGFAIGVPRAELTASIRDSVAVVLGIGFALVAVGLALATVVGRRVSRPIMSLVEPATALGRGEPVTVARTGLREVDRVGCALEAASALLQRRLEERDQAETALALSHQTLEGVVAERTRELRMVNQRLRQEIVERERAEGELHQSHKMQAIGQLSGGVAHDFNNLLQGVSSCLHVVETRIKDPDVADLIRAAGKAVRRGAGLTQQLLAFSRRQQLTPRPVDVNRALAGMEELLHRTLGGTIDIVMALGGDLWPANADPQQLELALINLAINARDAMPDGGVLTIETANCAAPPAGLKAGDYVRLTVRDTGTGMSPEVLTRAFDPFFTTKEVGKGTGLGLSMVYGLARQLGGDVVLTSRPGEGATVSLFLPRATRSESAPAPDLDAPESAASSGTAEATVLVVDDDALVRAGLASTLDDLGYTVLLAATGAAALDILRGGDRVDFLLSDYAMPGMTGLETIQRARDLRPRLPAVIMTGYADTAAFAAPGSIEVLRKPFDRTALQHTIERTLAAARLAGDYVTAVAGRAG